MKDRRLENKDNKREEGISMDFVRGLDDLVFRLQGCAMGDGRTGSKRQREEDGN